MRSPVEPLLDDPERFLEHRPEVLLGEPEARMLGRLPAAADAELEAPAGELVEHADFLEQPHRMVQRQEVDQRAELDRRGMLRGGGEEHRRRRGHAQFGGVVFGQVIAVKAQLFIEFDQPQPLRVLRADGHAVGVDMVEDAEAHPARAHRTT